MPDDQRFPGVMSKVVSPWSGNTVLLQAMLHAIFIWYGLYYFWRLARQGDSYNKVFIDKQLRMIVNGFKAFDAIAYFNRSGVVLEDYLIDIYAGMRRNVLASN
jgi:hypothetical protein